MPTIPNSIIKAYRTELRRLVTDMRRRTQLTIESYSDVFNYNAEQKNTTGRITFSETRFNELSRLIRVGIYSAIEKAKSTTSVMVDAIINNAEYYAAQQMKKMGYGDSFFAPIPRGTFQTIIMRHQQELDNMGIDLHKEIVRSIQDAIQNGLKISQIMGNLVDVYKKSWNEATAIARTEANRFWNLIMEQRYIQLGAEYHRIKNAGSTSAIKVCSICKPLDNKVFKIGEPIKLNNGKTAYRPPFHTHCYDNKTEVLTNNGWKLFKDVEETDKIFSLVPKTHNVEWVDFKQKIQYHYTGKMLHFVSKTMNLCITPKHRMYVAKRHWKTREPMYTIEEAQDLIMDNGKPNSERKIYVSSEWNTTPQHISKMILQKTLSFFTGNNGEEKITDSIIIAEEKVPLDTFCKFMGYYLSEGSCSKRGRNWYTVKITQEKQDNYERIWNDIKNLPCNVYKANGYIGLDSTFGSYLHQFGTAKTKFIPRIIKDLPKEYLELFLDAYLLGDGTTKNKEVEFRGVTYIDDSKTLFTSSKQMMSDLCEIIIKCGYSCSVRKQKSTITEIKGKEYHCSGIYRINILKSKHRDLKQVKEIDYDDMVYCVELEKNGILLVKRKGRIAWCGNCRCGTEIVPPSEITPELIKKVAART